MSFELFNSIATFGTFLVISATAIAALVQLRHTRGSNQIVAMNSLREATVQPDYVEGQNFVLVGLSKALQDPGFRHQISHRAQRTPENQKVMAKMFAVGNFYSYIGDLVRLKLLQPEPVFSIWGPSAILLWHSLLPVTAIIRRGDPTLWANFEYAAVLAEDFARAQPPGEYPPKMRRLEVKDEWLEADERYATSLASA